MRAYRHGSRKLFAELGPARARSVKVVVPLTIYVGVIPCIGIYLASMLLIAGFMRWLGRYGWLLIAADQHRHAGASPTSCSKCWFLVPLPKGPIEELARPLMRCAA